MIRPDPHATNPRVLNLKQDGGEDAEIHASGYPFKVPNYIHMYVALSSTERPHTEVNVVLLYSTGNRDAPS